MDTELRGGPITVPSHSDWSRKGACPAQGLPQEASLGKPRHSLTFLVWQELCHFIQCGNGQVGNLGISSKQSLLGCQSPDPCMSYRPLWGSLMHEARSTLLEVWLWELEFHPLLAVNSLCISTHQNEKETDKYTLWKNKAQMLSLRELRVHAKR